MYLKKYWKSLNYVLRLRRSVGSPDGEGKRVDSVITLEEKRNLDKDYCSKRFRKGDRRVGEDSRKINKSQNKTSEQKIDLCKH